MRLVFRQLYQHKSLHCSVGDTTIDISYICVRTDSFNNATQGDTIAMMFYYLSTVPLDCDFFKNSVTFVNWVCLINSGNASVEVNKHNVAFSILNVAQIVFSTIRNLYLASRTMKNNKDIVRQSLTKKELEDSKEQLEAAQISVEYFDIVIGTIFTIIYFALKVHNFQSFVVFSLSICLGSSAAKFIRVLMNCN